MNCRLQSFRWTCSLLLLLGSSIPLAQAEASVGGSVADAVLFDNIGANGGLSPSGASPASQIDLVFPFDAGAADDFVLGQSPLCLWAVTEVRWSGVYWGDEDSNAVEGFRFVLWPDVGGAPPTNLNGVPDLSEALAVFEVSHAAGEVSNPSGATGAHDYSAVLPQAFEASPNTRYWIQIQAKMPYPPQWGMHITHTRTGLGPVEYFDILGLPAWSAVPGSGDLAFALVGHALSISCDDGNACTTGACVGGGCVFTQVACDDGDACTVDSCSPLTGCEHTALECNDGSACTNEQCDPAVGCVTTPVGCDDGDQCTVDSCNPSAGCGHSALDCNDGNACTNDRCDPVVGCVASPVVCDDGSACTIDSCNPSTGCAYAAIECNDGDACTTDQCDPAVGCVTSPVVCDDGNSCTVDECDPSTGCQNVSLFCDDDDSCTADSCAGGVCTHTAHEDFDGDGDIDLTDLEILTACLDESLRPVEAATCDCSDLNHDGRVDMLDFALFQSTFTMTKKP